MKKYEYKVDEYVLIYDLEKTLNKMGAQGWRCISITQDQENDCRRILVFEREL